MLPSKSGAQAPWVRKGTTAAGKPTGAPRATRPDEAQRTNTGPRGTPERHTAGHIHGTQTDAKQGRPGAPQTWAGHTTRNEPWHGSRCQVTPNPHTTNPGPGMAGYRQTVHIDKHTPQHPSQEWRGAAETRVQAKTTTPHTPARICRVRAERTQTNAHPNISASNGGAQQKLEPRHTRQHPSQEWQGTGRGCTTTHTPQQRSQERRQEAETRA